MLRTATAMGVSPAVFWRLSLREWRMLTAPYASRASMARSEFERLAETWPDE
ncbi:MAG: phage tail assembly chaperone [Brevundimonas sp.]|nr:MAG: phage tail assembly chaperone [Brevundimonas sp.]